MTREEVLAMDPTELRIEVAEKIFHAKVIGRENTDPPQFLLVGDKGDGWKPLSSKRWQNAEWHYSEEAAWNDCPEYAESISAAWEVVETFPLVQVEYVEIFEGAKSANVRVWANGSDLSTVGIVASANTVPEGICRAALLAVLEATP